MPGRLPSSNRQHLDRKVPHLTERRVTLISRSVATNLITKVTAGGAGGLVDRSWLWRSSSI